MNKQKSFSHPDNPKTFLHIGENVFHFIKESFWVVPTIIIILAIGIGVISSMKYHTEGKERKTLEDRAKTAATAISLSLLEPLEGSQADLEKPEYIELKDLMQRIREANQDSRFVYLMGYKGEGDQLFFYVDSEPPESEDYSPPGDLYEDTNTQQLDAFKNAYTFVEGPLSDQWGNWVSGFAPIVDPNSGRPVALLGIDIDSSIWEDHVQNAILIPVIITIVLIIMFLVYGAFTLVMRQNLIREHELENIKTEFMSLASHQMRVPITAIQWTTELLQDTKLDKEQKAYVDQIRESNTHGLHLINDLLTISRMESKMKFALVKKSTDIIDLLKNVEKELGSTAQKKEISFQHTPEVPKSYKVRIDAEKISHVLQNLLSNAIKYGNEKTHIRIDFSKPRKKFIRISVTNQGLGIPKDQQSRIFEKFFRAENVHQQNIEGTGLGLSIAKDIAEKHGGTLTFISEENKETTFSLTLPV